MTILIDDFNHQLYDDNFEKKCTEKERERET